MDEKFLTQIMSAHENCRQCPKSEEIAGFFNQLLGLLFPTFTSQRITDRQKLQEGFETLRATLDAFLIRQNQQDLKISDRFFEQIPVVYDSMQKDVDAILLGDPAAKDREEVIRSYPGFYAISAYRVAHLLLTLDAKNLPRSITEHAHSRTGIDIHPGAQIGEYFCIDHGTGVVIGETTEIGNHVKIYQGVTLGGLSVDKRMANTKRHPTIEDGVVIYSGATILGGETIIGKGAVIGGNVWLTKSVPAGAKVYYTTQLVTDGEDSGSETVIIKEAIS